MTRCAPGALLHLFDVYSQLAKFKSGIASSGFSLVLAIVIYHWWHWAISEKKTIEIPEKERFQHPLSRKLCDTPWKFKGQKPRPMDDGNYTPENSVLFLIDPWNFQSWSFFKQYPWKFHVCVNRLPHPCLYIFWIVYL